MGVLRRCKSVVRRSKMDFDEKGECQLEVVERGKRDWWKSGVERANRGMNF